MTKCQLDDLIYRFMQTYLVHSKFLAPVQLYEEEKILNKIREVLSDDYGRFTMWANEQYRLKGVR